MFVLLTCALSWIPCVLLGQVWTRDVPQPLRFLIVSIIYGVSMGWQPLVAVWIVRRFIDRGWLDDVLTTARSPYFVLAAIAPPVLAGTAMGIALVAGQRNLVPDLALESSSSGNLSEKPGVVGVATPNNHTGGPFSGEEDASHMGFARKEKNRCAAPRASRWCSAPPRAA